MNALRLLSLALVLVWAAHGAAFAQSPTKLCTPTSSGGCQVVGTDNPLPVASAATNGTVSIVTNALTVTAGAYAANDSLGGLQTLSSVGTNGGYLQSVSITSTSGVTSEIDLFIFNANPSASTCTNDAAFALAAADVGKLLPGSPIAVTSSFAAGTPTVRVAQNLAIPFAATTLYVCYVTRGTPTFSATTDTSVQLGFVLN